MPNTNDTTPHFNLPLPHPGNEGVDDCLRLRQALTDVDTALKSVADDVITKADAADINAALEGFSVDMGTVMEHKADTATVNTALALKADKSTVALALEGVATDMATVTASLAQKADATATAEALALKADAASNAADHDTLLAEITEVDAKAQQALNRDPLPSMADAAGKFLSTNGSQAQWTTLETQRDLAIADTATAPDNLRVGGLLIVREA